MILNMAGGGGAGGKIYVVGGTVQPASPKENTIWVNTSVTITSWVMQYDQPASPTQGMAWIVTSGYSNAALNPFSKMTAYYYIISAKVYNNGSWVRCGGSVYTNGTWHAMRIYFYDHGDECSAVTGGWISGSSTSVSYTFTKNADNMYIHDGSANYSSYSMYPTNLIDLTNISTLHCQTKYDVVGNTGGCSINAINGNPATSAYDTGTYYSITMNDGIQNHALDVSALSGSYYIRLTITRAYNESDAYLYELYGD